MWNFVHRNKVFLFVTVYVMNNKEDNIDNNKHISLSHYQVATSEEFNIC